LIRPAEVDSNKKKSAACHSVTHLRLQCSESCAIP
jgi:hypothetical protein